MACHPKLARDSCERRLERETGIEPATNSLEGFDATTELLPPTRSTPSLFRATAGKPAVALPARPAACRTACQPAKVGLPTVARRDDQAASEGWWRGKDSNLRSHKGDRF